jgi:aryl-alcohol dehydrogenase-like predicted oxidoreductase
MIPWSPLAMGYLARPHASFKDSERGGLMGGTFLGNKITEADERINEKIEEIAKKRGTSMAIVSMAWSLTKPYITSPIVGMSSVKRVQDAVDAVDFELTKEEEESIDKLYESRAVMGIAVSNPDQKPS